MTALQLEADAVLEHLENQWVEFDSNNTVYSMGYFQAGDVRWKVAVVECGQGNQRAGLLASSAISFLDPNILMFVGIAGGLKSDICLGDVVASTKVYNIHSAKAGQDFFARPAVENTCHKLEQLARLVVRHKLWHKRISRTHADQQDLPKGFVGPLASSEQVIANLTSETFEIIEKHYNDAQAVEMEGYGALAAANLRQVDGIIVRSISDQIRNKTESDKKGWQPFAAHNACAFALEILANYRIGNQPFTLNLSSDNPDQKASQAALTKSDNSSTPPSASELDQLNNASKQLLNWPSDLGRGEWIQRPELRIIFERITTSPQSVTLLLGVPGSGKTALLARLGRELQKQDHSIIAIKADSLDETVFDATTLAKCLGLSTPLNELVTQIANTRKVVLLIDQLDAVAALVDLHSGRLNTLLNLIRDMSDMHNVHVVCTCREFEYNHDARLTSIEADGLRLALPSWEQVAEVLKARGIPHEGWSESRQDLLKPPQQLKVFLQCVTDSNEHKVFSSYQQMLDDLWKTKITNSPGPIGRSDLVMEIASEMGNRESLWVPTALFETKEGLIANLVGSGILTKGEGGSKIGFAHQTVFDHAWARAFAREKCSLATYTLERQDGLFIRAIVWSGLTYLRGADPANYQREFGRLWNHIELRKHLRYLLIDFLGGVNQPGIQEESWLSQALLDSKLEGKALAAIRDNAGWFSILSKTLLPGIMRSNTPNAWQLTSLLIAGATAEYDTCISLLKDHWLPDAKNDQLAWQVLYRLPSWNEDAYQCVVSLVKRANVNRAVIYHLAQQMGQTNPSLAIRLVATLFQQELEKLESETDPSLPESTGSESDPNQFVQRMSFEPHRRFQDLLNDRKNWSGLDELAEREPLAFLTQIWPLFIRTLEHTLSSSLSDHRKFKTNYSVEPAFEDGDDEYRKYPLSAAIDLAIRTISKSSFSDFEKLLESEMSRDALLVQRLLARGLTCIGETYPKLGLRFLCQDHRRFNLGIHQDEHLDSVRLIQAVAQSLTKNELAPLEQALLDWNYIEASPTEYDAQARFHAQQYNRKHRLRLLSAIPMEKLSASTQGLIIQEKDRFPDHKQAGVSKIQGGFIGSPMSEAQMKLAKDEDIINLFNELPDNTRSEHPKDWLRGGSEQASNEFERFAQTSPERAVAIIKQLKPAIQENPVGAGILGLSKSSYPDAELFQLIIDLDNRGFSTEEFRTNVARSVSSRLKDGLGLPDAICNLLVNWLSTLQITDSYHSVEQNNSRSEEIPLSVLWQSDGFVMIPNGAFHFIHALTYGYLLRTPPEPVKWLNILQSHLDRQDKDSTWKLLSRDFRYLHMCDHSEATAFLQELFDRFPSLLESEEGAILLTNVWSFVPDNELWNWLDKIRQSSWQKGTQAFGELIALRAVVFSDDQRAQQEIRSALASVETTDETTNAIRIGIAFTCVNMWEDDRARDASTKMLTQLISKAEGPLAKVISRLFLLCDYFPADTATHHVLESLYKHPKTLHAMEDGWFLERIESLLPYEASLIYQLCMELVQNRGEAITDFSQSWALHNANLTNIAITLHRMENPYRAMGLELFEALLDIRVPDAEAALREIDSRVPGHSAIIRQRSPRPGRRKRAA